MMADVVSALWAFLPMVRVLWGRSALVFRAAFSPLNNSATAGAVGAFRS
jgi:hypothetical protein